MADASWQRLSEPSVRPALTAEAGRLLAPIFLLIFAETFILLGRIVPGLLIHATVFLGLLGWISTGPSHSNILEITAFVPLLRLLNLGTGILAFNPYLWLSGVYLLLLLSLVLVMRNYGVTLESLGISTATIRGESPLILGGILAGVALGTVQWVLDLEQPPTEPTVTNIVIAILVTGLLVGFVEELLFRGLLQEWLTEIVDVRVSIVIVSVLFGFMHSVWLNPLDVVFAFVVSLLLGVVYAATRNFWFILLVHALINTMAFGVFPLLSEMGIL